MRLWDKGIDVDDRILNFTVGDDFLLDMRLVPYDCRASIAHARMLHKIGILSEAEAGRLVEGLTEIIGMSERGTFRISKDQEDGHTAIEAYLTERYGDVGKKIHLGRSRNDQVLTALRLFEKEALARLKSRLLDFRQAIMEAIERFGHVPLPGYTHMRKAMPSTIGMWWGSFAAAVDDDLALWKAVYGLVDRSPLGSAAGFGVPVFELDRRMTAELMGFSTVLDNPLYSQLSRGKIEMMVLSLLTGIMFNLNRLASDLCLFSMDEFGYVSLPEEFCTGSSIMPQKKNPDVLELVRAKYHVTFAAEFEVKSLAANLISGYNRDLQLTKKPLFTSLDTTQECLEIMSLVMSGVTIDEARCRAALTDELFATEEVYRLVKTGMPFREAYRQVSLKYSGASSNRGG